MKKLILFLLFANFVFATSVQDLFDENKAHIEKAVQENYEQIKIALPLTVYIQLTENDYLLQITKEGAVRLVPGTGEGDLLVVSSEDYIEQIVMSEDPIQLINNTNNFLVKGNTIKGKLVKGILENRLGVTFKEPEVEKGLLGSISEGLKGIVSGVFLAIANFFV